MNTMPAKIALRSLPLLTLVFLGVAVSTAAAAKAGPPTAAPATATATFGASINNPAGQAVYADLAGPYKDGAYTDSLGADVTGICRPDLFLRTVSSSGSSAQNIRGIYLDLSRVVAGSAPAQSAIADPNDASGAVLHLGDTTSINFIPDMRILASNLFSNTTVSKGATVSLVFSLQPEFTGSGDFEIDFEANVSVAAPNATTRVLTAGTNAIGHLYVFNGSKKVSVGRFYLPFTLTVTTN
jgi:hypothetical protein